MSSGVCNNMSGLGKVMAIIVLFWSDLVQLVIASQDYYQAGVAWPNLTFYLKPRIQYKIIIINTFQVSF